MDVKSTKTLDDDRSIFSVLQPRRYIASRGALVIFFWFTTRDMIGLGVVCPNSGVLVRSIVQVGYGRGTN